MSITAQTAKTGPYVMASFPQACPSGFPFQFSSDLLVINAGQTSAPRDPGAVLVLGSDYTVAGGGYNSSNQMQTGAVTVLSTGTNACIAGDIIWILRTVPENQIASATSAPLTTVLIEEALDKCATIDQQQQEQANRSLQFENFETISGILSLANRKNSLLGFDGNGLPFFTPTSLVGLQIMGAPVATIAALRAIATASLPGNVAIELLGYYSAGDGGGGLFYFNASSSATDDGGLTIAPTVGTGRWIRIYTGALYCAWFGTKADGVTNDAPAIQAALNAVSGTGNRVYLPVGTCAIGSTLVPKLVNGAPAYRYGLLLSGQTVGISTAASILKATFAGPVFQAIAGTVSFAGRDTELTLENFVIDGNSIATIGIQVQYFAGLNIRGVGVKACSSANYSLGVAGTDNYSLVFDNCYSGGTYTAAGNVAHNNYGLFMQNCRYAHIVNYISDGSAYAINHAGGDKGFFEFCHCEGSQITALNISGIGGGQNRINNNWFFPYVGSDNNAWYAGTLQCINIAGSSGGCAANLITGNELTVSNGTVITAPISSISGTFLVNVAGNILSGGTSGATGYIIGVTGSKINILPISGTFVAAETVTQAGTAAHAVLGSITLPASYGLQASGSAIANCISANLVEGPPAIGMVLTTDQNAVTGNNVNASITAIYKDAPFASVTGNILTGTTNAYWNVSGTVAFTGNVVVAGALNGLGSAIPVLAVPTALSNGAAAAAGTLTNAPSAGNPTKWVQINDAGTVRSIPAW